MSQATQHNIMSRATQHDVMLFALPKGKIIKTRNTSKRSDVEFMDFIENRFNAKFIRIKKEVR